MDNMIKIDEILSTLPEEFAMRWCENGICGCLGCVNFTAGKNGITRDKWEEWMVWKNPSVVALRLKED